MGDRDDLDLERIKRQTVTGFHNIELDALGTLLVLAANIEQACSERRGVNRRCAEPWVKIKQGADMVFMRMGDDNGFKPVLLPLDKFQIGHDQINARQIITRKADAAIHQNPLALGGWAIAI